MASNKSTGATTSAPEEKKLKQVCEQCQDDLPLADDSKAPSTEIGADHALLKTTAGKWEVDCLFYMGGTESKYSATCTREMVIGGRFLREVFEMDFGGMPYIGEQLIGCFEKEFQSTYVDSMSNMIYYYKGKQLVGPDGKTEIEFKGEPVKDWTCGKLKTARHRLIFGGPDDFIFEGYETFLDEGVERLMMHFEYKRA